MEVSTGLEHELLAHLVVVLGLGVEVLDPGDGAFGVGPFEEPLNRSSNRVDVGRVFSEILEAGVEGVSGPDASDLLDELLGRQIADDALDLLSRWIEEDHGGVGLDTESLAPPPHRRFRR